MWKVLDTGPKEELSHYRLAFPLFDEISQIISMTVTFVTFVLLTKVNGFTKRTKHLIKYLNLPSAISPVPHGPDIPIPALSKTLEISPEDDDDFEDRDAGEDWMPSSPTFEPRLLQQCKLNDLTRDLGLSKESALILGSYLHESI